MGVMFEDFARQWTPVLPAAAVKSEPRRVVLAGTPLVVWRSRGGRLSVLVDRCPHRGVSLALGSCTGDGRLRCGFHGWEFEPDGSNAHIPFNPASPRGPRGVLALPNRELGGLVWVFTGFDPDTEPAFSPHLADASLVRFDHHEDWACHWTRAMENMLDYPHLPYVHHNTIGRFMRGKQRRESALDFDLTDTEYGYRFGARIDEHRPGAYLSWYRPNSMILDTIPEPRLMRVQIFCIPTEANRTRMLLVTARNFAKNPAASAVFDRFNLKVLHQDRAIVESSDPPEVPAEKLERSVRSDRPTLTFRTWYLRNLKGTSVPEPA